MGEMIIWGNMRCGLFVIGLCLFCCLFITEVEGSTHSRNLRRASQAHAERGAPILLRKKTLTFQDIIKNVGLSSISFKNALSKDDVPFESEYILNVSFSHNF